MKRSDSLGEWPADHGEAEAHSLPSTPAVGARQPEEASSSGQQQPVADELSAIPENAGEEQAAKEPSGSFTPTNAVAAEGSASVLRARTRSLCARRRWRLVITTFRASSRCAHPVLSTTLARCCTKRAHMSDLPGYGTRLHMLPLPARLAY